MRILPLMFCAMAAYAQSDVEAGRRQFNIRCAGCHGEDGLGGERAPGIGKGSRKRLQTDEAVRGIVSHGIPDSGMPAFDIPDTELAALTAFVRSRVTPLSLTAWNGDAGAGERYFFGKGGCSECHMVQGHGGIKGPDLTEASRNLTAAEVETSLRHPNDRRVAGYRVATVELKSGAKVRGFIRNESGFDLQLLGLDQKLYLLSEGQFRIVARETGSPMPPMSGSPVEYADLIAFLRAAPERKISQPLPAALPGALAWSAIAHPAAGEWPTYHGQLSGNRYSELARINLANVDDLAPAWSFPAGTGQAMETTPVVAGGVMYATAVNSVFALDARAGRKIWVYSRPRSKDLVGDAAGGINRGVAMLGDRVFLVTDNAHLIALHRLTGGLLWDVEMADSRQHYGATSAPLIAGGLVISGVSGGDEGIRGKLFAFRADTGERVWTFNAIPDRGDPEAATWAGKALEHGCGSTWLTGTYDVETDTLFWPIGNPCPDFNGDERRGDNLYTDSVVALDPRTGKRKWHYQFTPHDLHDWDATETPMLVDANYQGRKRRLLLQGNRNGFFYVLDRATGTFLHATPFVRKLNWASGIGSDGRPVLTEQHAETCPSMDGATNWMSTAYHPRTGLFYLVALEKCTVFTKNAEWWKQGESFYGGTARPVDRESPRKFVRAIEVETGKISWEREQAGPGENWGGLLATAGGLLFSADESGAFAALNAATGSPVWHFQMNAAWHASPMTYAIDGRQFVAIAAGSNIVAFALSKEEK
ncbi:MAG: PQQ-binding-like beta-propeller repeat protein [Bryobacteraceae bacterium]